MEVVNWKIISHPMNWVTLFLMVFIGGIALHLILAHLPMIATNSTLKKVSASTS